MKRPSIHTLLVTSWRILSTVAIITLGIALLLFMSLETLLPGYAQVEVETARSARSFEAIADNPVNAPYKLLVLGVSEIIGDPLLATRISTAAVGAMCMVLFYVIIRKVHSKRIAFLATVLFATSAWFLHAARLGTPDIMLVFSILAFTLSGYWLVRNGRRSVYSVIAILAVAISIFVPGMLWFILAGLLVRRGKDILVVRRHVAAWQLGLLVFLIIALVIAPLAWAIIRDPKIALALLGLPSVVPDAVEFLKNLATIPISLFIAAPQDPVTWLGHLPLLDIATSALFALGIYYYFKFRQLDRAKFLGFFALGASILIALDSGVTIAILLPAVFVGIAGGVALMITQWFTVFPRNPLAQSVGVVTLALIIGMSSVYNLRAYFVAWPHWPPAKAAFSQTEADLVQ